MIWIRQLDSVATLYFCHLLRNINTEKTSEKCTGSPVYWPLPALSLHETIASYQSGNWLWHRLRACHRSRSACLPVLECLMSSKVWLIYPPSYQIQSWLILQGGLTVFTWRAVHPEMLTYNEIAQENKYFSSGSFKK